MRLWLCGLAAVAGLVGQAPADEPKAVIEKAIQAHGGADALSKMKAGSYEVKGEMALLGMELDFTGAVTYQIPGQFKMAIDTSVGGMKISILQVANGKSVKTSVNGMSSKLDEATTKEIQQAATMQEVVSLVPLVKGDKYTLSAEKDAEVDGKPASVVLVTAKDMKDLKMFFDKASGLLVKTSRKGLAPGMGDPVEVVEETTMTDYKPVSGVQSPMKMAVTHDGKKFMTMTVTKMELSESVDKKLFATDD